MSYQWKKDGSNLSDGSGITGSKSASLRVQSAQTSDAGKYQVQVSNSHGSVLSGQITVSVGQVQAPVANAGSDQSVYVNNTVTLDGSRSNDPQGYNLTYNWVQVSGPTATLSRANTSKPTFVASAEGTYEFRLTVSNGQLSSQDTVRVVAEEVNLGSIKLGIYLASQSKSSTKYTLRIDGTVADLNEVKQVYYYYYKTNGTYVNSQRSTSRAKNFGFSKMIKETFLVKAEVTKKDGTKFFLDGVLERLH